MPDPRQGLGHADLTPGFEAGRSPLFVPPSPAQSFEGHGQRASQPCVEDLRGYRPRPGHRTEQLVAHEGRLLGKPLRSQRAPLLFDLEQATQECVADRARSKAGQGTQELSLQLHVGQTLLLEEREQRLPGATNGECLDRETTLFPGLLPQRELGQERSGALVRQPAERAQDSLTRLRVGSREDPQELLQRPRVRRRRNPCEGHLHPGACGRVGPQSSSPSVEPSPPILVAHQSLGTSSHHRRHPRQPALPGALPIEQHLDGGPHPFSEGGTIERRVRLEERVEGTQQRVQARHGTVPVGRPGVGPSELGEDLVGPTLDRRSHIGVRRLGRQELQGPQGRRGRSVGGELQQRPSKGGVGNAPREVPQDTLTIRSVESMHLQRKPWFKHIEGAGLRKSLEREPRLRWFARRQEAQQSFTRREVATLEEHPTHGPCTAGAQGLVFENPGRDPGCPVIQAVGHRLELQGRRRSPLRLRTHPLQQARRRDGREQRRDLQLTELGRTPPRIGWRCVEVHEQVPRSLGSRSAQGPSEQLATDGSLPGFPPSSSEGSHVSLSAVGERDRLEARALSLALAGVHRSPWGATKCVEGRGRGFAVIQGPPDDRVQLPLGTQGVRQPRRTGPSQRFRIAGVGQAEEGPTGGLRDPGIRVRREPQEPSGGPVAGGPLEGTDQCDANRRKPLAGQSAGQGIGKSRPRRPVSPMAAPATPRAHGPGRWGAGPRGPSGGVHDRCPGLDR